MTPIISPGRRVKDTSRSTVSPPGYAKERFSASTSMGAESSSSSSSGSSVSFKSGFIRFQDTRAFWTELKSFAALEDFTAILVKQDKKAVNAAMFHAVQPVPAMFLPPSHMMNTTPVMEMTL